MIEQQQATVAVRGHGRDERQLHSILLDVAHDELDHDAEARHQMRLDLLYERHETIPRCTNHLELVVVRQLQVISDADRVGLWWRGRGRGGGRGRRGIRHHGHTIRWRCEARQHRQQRAQDLVDMCASELILIGIVRDDLLASDTVSQRASERATPSHATYESDGREELEELLRRLLELRQRRASVERRPPSHATYESDGREELEELLRCLLELRQRRASVERRRRARRAIIQARERSLVLLKVSLEQRPRVADQGREQLVGAGRVILEVLVADQGREQLVGAGRVILEVLEFALDGGFELLVVLAVLDGSEQAAIHGWKVCGGVCGRREQQATRRSRSDMDW